MGNFLTQVAVVLILVCHACGVGVTDENPERSFHWQQPCMIAVCRTAFAFEALLDYCHVGTAWKKGTRIRGNRPWVEGLAARCCGGHKHIPLRGSTCQDGKRIPWTALASPYPWPLVRLWSHWILSSYVGVPPPDSFTNRLQRSRRSTGVLNLNDLDGSSGRLLLRESVARYSHIDDHAAVGSDAAEVTQAVAAISSSLAASGFNIGECQTAGEVERYVRYASQQQPARWTLPLRKLALIDAGLAHFLTWKRCDAAILRSLVGQMNWVCLLRRCLFSILHAVYDVLESYNDGEVFVIFPAVRAEIRAFRRLLPLAYADCHRLVAPVTFAQDAEGASFDRCGGFGIGCAVPGIQGVVDVALHCMSSHLSHDLVDQQSIVIVGGPNTLSDRHIPESWTNGETEWTELWGVRTDLLSISTFLNPGLCVELLKRWLPPPCLDAPA